MADWTFRDGTVRYPDDLPCPHADTDLTPRERRYISDIGEVKKLRRFQSTYQATRQNISFVFTSEQSRRFREWYKHDIIEGGAWFYADWPILHKEKSIAYRFVTRPVWEFLSRGNYHVSATVELYEGRKVGKIQNVFTSKIYPIFTEDALQFDIAKIRAFPFVNADDAIGFGLATVVGAQSDTTIYTERYFDDTIRHKLAAVVSVESFGGRKEIGTLESLALGLATVTAATSKDKITYDYLQDALSFGLATVVAGEKT